MADKKISNERKKELEQLDPFQQNLLKAAAFSKEHQKHLLLIGAVVIIVVAVFSSIMYSFKKAENTAAVFLNQAMTEYAAQKDPEKGFQAVQKDFMTIFSDYANTTSGKLARVEFAKICYDASRFDMSFEHYKKAYDLFKSEMLMENFLLASLGHVCLARGDKEQASKYFQKIEKSKTALLKDEAGYMLAMINEASGDLSKAGKRYEKLVSDFPDSIYSQVAGSKIK